MKKIVKKRILQIAPLPPLIGGISVSLGRLCDRLLAEGYDVVGYNIKYHGKYNKYWKVIEAFKYFYIPFFVLFNKRFDVIHVHVSGVLRKLYITMAKTVFFPRTKLIFTIHGDVNNFLRKKLASISLSGADRIICVKYGDSNFLPEKYRKKAIDIPAFILPVQDDSSTVIPNVILDFIKKDDKPLIVFSGMYVTTDLYDDLYGFGDIVRLYKDLKSEQAYFKLLIICYSTGNNQKEKNLRDVITGELVGKDDVLYVENMQVNLCSIFRYSKIYIRPTKTDGDALSIREALCLNNIAVVSNVVNRPHGAVIYELGDTQDLLGKARSALSSEVVSQIEYEKTEKDFYNKIKEQYD